MKKYRLKYSGVKDFATKKELDRFIKKETFQLHECLKKKKGVYVIGQQLRYPYGKFIWDTH